MFVSVAKNKQNSNQSWVAAPKHLNLRSNWPAVSKRCGLHPNSLARHGRETPCPSNSHLRLPFTVPAMTEVILATACGHGKELSMPNRNFSKSVITNPWHTNQLSLSRIHLGLAFPSSNTSPKTQWGHLPKAWTFWSTCHDCKGRTDAPTRPGPLQDQHHSLNA